MLNNHVENVLHYLQKVQEAFTDRFYKQKQCSTWSIQTIIVHPFLKLASYLQKGKEQCTDSQSHRISDTKDLRTFFKIPLLIKQQWTYSEE